MNVQPNITKLGPALRDGGEPIDGRTVDVLRADGAVAGELADPDDTDASAPQLQRAWLPPLAALVVIAAWTAWFVWANFAAMRASAPAAQWTEWVTAWSVPVLLVLVMLIVVTRSSRREAVRFADAAQSLNHEAARLESRLSTINTELSLARDFIASQARDLEALGRIAADRLTGNAARLQELIQTNGAQVDRIGEVSDHALINMEKLRGQLPVIANSAKDVTNTIGNAGRAAHIQLEDLVAGFQRLNEFGLASERHVAQVRERVDAALEQFGKAAERITALTNERFGALDEAADAHRVRLDQEEIAALAAIRARSDALASELGEQRAALTAAEQEAAAALARRFAALQSESGTVGRSITQIEEVALAAFAERAGAQVAALRAAIEELSRQHDTLVDGSEHRLASFEESAQNVAARLADEAEALDAKLAQRRAQLMQVADQQGEQLSHQLSELDRVIGERRTAMSAAAAEAADALRSKLAELDAAIARQRQSQIASAEALGTQCDAIADRLAAFSATLHTSSAQGRETAATLDGAMRSLNQQLIDMRGALGGTDREIGTLTDSAVRLLELIQASGDHTRTQLPEALRSTEAGLGLIEDRVAAMRDALREAGDNGRALSDHVGTARGDLDGAVSEIAALQHGIAAHTLEQTAALTNLRDTLVSARRESEALSTDIEESLGAAIARLADAAGQARDDLSEGTLHQIEALADTLGERSTAAIARVLQGRGAELIARLEDAIDTAAAASRDTAIQMRDQLAKVDELAGNLESRVARARERADEQVNNDFARRTAIITESLNSTAIDIAKAISADVSETAWASYLRGDRGIFTRRAVSLLDNGEVRAVQQHYENDREFHQNVNRYIHDFESMLRQLLSTRDGNALGVTLLSSDMGKLYVALAQGIERLRT